MFATKSLIFFKNQFRHLTFYSIPTSILLVLRKRLNFIFIACALLILTFYTVL